MAVTVYKSSDASAPVLSGQVGALIALLDAVLVNGYGAKGAAGWTKPYAGTNLAVYRMATAGASGFYLNVDDNQPSGATQLVAGPREAQARGFETKTGTDVATGVTNGTNPFPTVAQAPVGGCFIRKSTSDGATARPWVMVADNKTFYLFTLPGGFTGWTGFMFGDIYSLKGTDPYRCMINGRIATGGSQLSEGLELVSALTAITGGHLIARTAKADDATPQILPVTAGKHGNAAHSAVGLVGLSPYPNPVDNGVLLSRLWVHEPGIAGQPSNVAVIRGRLRGCWQWLHPVGANVQDGDTITGAGDLAGKSFLIIKPSTNGLSLYVMETSDTWETSA